MANLEGKKAPTFILQGNDGKTHSLEDYKGKTVVLYFYPKVIRPVARRKHAALETWARLSKRRER